MEPEDTQWCLLRFRVTKHLKQNLMNEENMDLTTTPSLEGRRIARYRGIVAGEAVLGANVFKDMFASISSLMQNPVNDQVKYLS